MSGDSHSFIPTDRLAVAHCMLISHSSPSFSFLFLFHWIASGSLVLEVCVCWWNICIRIVLYLLKIAIHWAKPVRVNMGYHFNVRFIQIRFMIMCVSMQVRVCIICIWEREQKERRIEQIRMKKLRTCPKITRQTSNKQRNTMKEESFICLDAIPFTYFFWSLFAYSFLIVLCLDYIAKWFYSCGQCLLWLTTFYFLLLTCSKKNRKPNDWHRAERKKSVTKQRYANMRAKRNLRCDHDGNKTF